MELWKRGQVPSPTEFNTMLRNEAYKELNRFLNRSADMKTTQFMDPVLLSMFSDQITNYYQNLSYQVSLQIGHNITSIRDCMWIYGQNRIAFGHQCKDKMLTVKKFSHPKFFNCFTVEPATEYESVISNLNLIIMLGPDPLTLKTHTESFIIDLFEQAYGIRVVVHEPKSYPQIESKGIQIEPGRLNELSYKSKLNVKVNTDIKPCTNNYENKQYKDLNNIYGYDLDLCFNSLLQKAIVKKCNCMYAYFPRYVEPNAKIPYCGSLNNNFANYKKRIKCVSTFFNEQGNFKQDLRKNLTCLERCVKLEYDVTTSVTKWRTTDWQFYWLKHTTKNWDDLYKLFLPYRFNTSKPITGNDQLKLNKIIKNINQYLTRKNLTESLPDHDKLEFNDRFTFLAIKRQSNNTYIQEERLVLTFNALVSRIGGLCSLYIGLTFAFFIELIDFLYTILFLRNSDHQKSNHDKFNKYESYIEYKKPKKQRRHNVKSMLLRSNLKRRPKGSLRGKNASIEIPSYGDVEKNSYGQQVYWNLSNSHNNHANSPDQSRDWYDLSGHNTTQQEYESNENDIEPQNKTYQQESQNIWVQRGSEANWSL